MIFEFFSNFFKVQSNFCYSNPFESVQIQLSPIQLIPVSLKNRYTVKFYAFTSTRQPKFQTRLLFFIPLEKNSPKR
jgi:hypothetical protein